MSDWDSVSASASNWDSVSIPERRKKPGRMSERAEAYRLPPAPGEPDLPLHVKLGQRLHSRAPEEAGPHERAR